MSPTPDRPLTTPEDRGEARPDETGEQTAEQRAEDKASRAAVRAFVRELKLRLLRDADRLERAGMTDEAWAYLDVVEHAIPQTLEAFEADDDAEGEAPGSPG